MSEVGDRGQPRLSGGAATPRAASWSSSSARRSTAPPSWCAALEGNLRQAPGAEEGRADPAERVARARAPPGDRRVRRQGARLAPGRLRAPGRPADEPLRRHLPAPRHALDRPRCRRRSPRSPSTCSAPSSFVAAAAARRTGDELRDRAARGAGTADAAFRGESYARRRRRWSTPRSPTACCGWGRPTDSQALAAVPLRVENEIVGALVLLSCSTTSRSCAPRTATCSTCSRRTPPRPCSPPALFADQGPEAAHAARAWSSWRAGSKGAAPRPLGRAGRPAEPRTAMGISGSLEDVSVADVMQFIHLGRRTGTLLLARGRERAMIGFHLGRLVSAQAPRTPQARRPAGLDCGAARPRRASTRRIARPGASEARAPLARPDPARLAARSPPRALRDVIARADRAGGLRGLLWEHRHLRVRASTTCSRSTTSPLYPSDVLPDADINTQMVLLEAARIFDERNREQADEPRRTPAPRRGDGDSTTRAARAPSGPRGRRAGGARRRGRARGRGARSARSRRPRRRAARAAGRLGATRRSRAALAAGAAATELAAVGRVDLGRGRAGGARATPPPIVLVDLRHRRGGALERAAAILPAHPRRRR